VVGKEIGVSADGRYFMDRSTETPWFYLADTAWPLFKRLDLDSAEGYLSNRAAKGFTAIQAYVLRGLDVPNLEGHKPLVDRDPTKLDEGFFGNVDRIVNRANEHGLVMGLVASHGEHVSRSEGPGWDRDGERIFTVDNAARYGEIMGSRYAQHAVIWYLGGDRTPTPEAVAVWDAMGRGLAGGSGGRHLVSYHSAGGHSSSDAFHHHEWLDFNTVQSLHRSADPNYVLIRADRALSPVKPTLDMEARYEDHPDLNDQSVRIDSHQVREAAYWAVLAGAAGHGYGHQSIWQMADRSRTANTADYTLRAGPPTVAWHEAMDAPGAFEMSHLRRLVELRPWYRLEPDLSLIAAGQAIGEAHVQAALAHDGSFGLAYLPFGHPVSIHLERISGARVKALWFDPRTGSFDAIGTFPSVGVQEFIPPTSGPVDDWVLVFEDAARDLPTDPGRARG
jgi:hypothetical protein